MDDTETVVDKIVERYLNYKRNLSHGNPSISPEMRDLVFFIVDELLIQLDKSIETVDGC